MPLAYFNLGFRAGLLGLFQTIAPPIISALILFASARALGVQFDDAYASLTIVSSLLCYIFMQPATNTRDAAFGARWEVVRQTIIAWVAVFCVLLAIGYAMKTSAVYSRRVLFAWFVVTPPVMIGILLVVQRWFRRAVVETGRLRSTVIAGVNDASRRLASSINDFPELGFRLQGFFDDRALDRLGSGQGVALLGNLANLPNYVRTHRIDTIFIALPISHMQRAKDLLNELRDTTASIYFLPDIFVIDLIQSRTDEVNGMPVVALCETPFYGWRGVKKRVSDIVIASTMLTTALPVMLLIALLIKLTTRGSVIFKQRRYGLGGEEILVYKFRTMTVSEDGDELAQATRGDGRVTPVGRWLRRLSLDELPQLINVLQGRMSVVGPRPHAVAHNEEYRSLIPGYMVRHKVAPGITGLAQVNGCRGETSTLEEMQRRVQLDLDYLRHWSLWLDIKILIRTLAIWLRDERAY